MGKKSAQSYVHHDMHTLLCATPYAAGLWKKSVWSLHHCSVHILLFHGSRTLRPLVELRSIFGRMGSESQSSIYSL
ncbi:hypothetical protein C2G38_2130475 [Gigaspora rosea]|uniref:Uncharacterized protein n=1 Tax=Gigaspora rosea TaxID=44941 RepID=A0A397TPJ2_9GLOM|nr:hypothetical protein C2G38_2130475 [Gigaspora rosea]